jgi:hypothetical protein
LDLEYVAFDLDDRRTYRPALVNTGLLALVTPADPRQSERELALIEAAERSGVQRILKPVRYWRGPRYANFSLRPLASAGREGA